MAETTKEDVATLLENFSSYGPPDGGIDSWFTLEQINQQFAWLDVDDATLETWLEDLELEGKVERHDRNGDQTWRWVE